MRISAKQVIIEFLLLIVLYSCGTEYMTVTPNTPLFKGGGEFQSELSLSHLYIGKLAFSPVNHIGILLNGQLHPSKGLDETNHHHQNHSCIEPVVGGYGNYKSFYYEGYIGYGVGKTDYESSLNPQDHDYYYYSKKFTQLNFAYIDAKNNQFGICVKNIWLKYNYEQTLYHRNTYCSIIEPSIFILPRLNKYMNVSFCLSMPFFTSDSFYPDMSILTFSIGIKGFINRKKD